MKNDYMGPGATTGVLRDALEREVGTFVTVHADDFETIVRVAVVRRREVARRRRTTSRSRR